MKLTNSQQKELYKDLQKFRKQYPGVTSGDIQTFILGWIAGTIKNKRTYLKNI
jgi:hypothetical protein